MGVATNVVCGRSKSISSKSVNWFAEDLGQVIVEMVLKSVKPYSNIFETIVMALQGAVMRFVILFSFVSVFLDMEINFSIAVK